MKVEYKRDLHSNYMILSEGKAMESDNYRIRMLEHNRIPGLLGCSVKSMDSVLSFYYDVSSRQPLSTYLEKETVGKELITLIFADLARTLDSLGEFLLDADGIMLEPDMIYLNAERKDLKFCYFPASESSAPDQLRTLSEALLPRLDQNDRDAVNMGYRFYSAAMADEVTIDFLRRIGEEQEESSRHPETAGGKPEKQPVSLPKGNEWDEEPEDLFRYETMFRQQETESAEEKQKRRGALIKMIPIALAVLVLVLAIWTGYILPGAGLSLLLAASGLLWDFLGSKRRKKLSCKRSPELDSDYETDRSDKEEIRNEQEESRDGQLREPEFCSDEETVLLEDYKEKPEEQTAWLSAEEGSGKIVLDRNFYLIGKSPSTADLVIEGAAVSRLHAKLQNVDGKWKISDLNSRNGTFVNDRLLQPGEEEYLEDGDRVRFADRGFLFGTWAGGKN